MRKMTIFIIIVIPMKEIKFVVIFVFLYLDLNLIQVLNSYFLCLMFYNIKNPENKKNRVNFFKNQLN